MTLGRQHPNNGYWFGQDNSGPFFRGPGANILLPNFGLNSGLPYAIATHPDLRVIDKSGRNPSTAVGDDIWFGSTPYTGFPATTDTLTIVSTDAADASPSGAGARTVRIFYMDAAGNIFDAAGEYLYLDVALAGLTPVLVSSTQVRRVWRSVVLTAGANRANAGNVSCYQTSTPANIFFVMPAGSSVTQASSFTIPAGWTGLIPHYAASITGSTAATVELAFRALSNGVARLVRPFVVSNGSGIERRPYGGTKFTELTDLSVRALNVSSGAPEVTVSYEILLVRNVPTL